MFELKVFVNPAELRWAGTPIRLRPRERLLLCRLAFAAGLSLSSRELAAGFTDQGSSGGAPDTLRRHVSNFRAAVRQAAGTEAGRRLLSTEPTGHGTVYRLHLEPESIDARRFTQVVEAGQHKLAENLASEAAADFTDALALWRAEPLRDVAGWPFARIAVTRLQAQRRIARIGLAEIRLAAGRPREVIDDLQEMTAEFPGDSQVWDLLIRCLWRDGRDSDAAIACKQALEAFHDRGLDTRLLQSLQDAVLTGSLSR
jgi:DNA-binding SARP family transcriptional activator